ncbi:MAG: aminopeptidase P family protein [Rhodothermaceae bacterium]|nr:aminopeptidase P family protein [Rhodothermaceae bacterium]
MSADHLIREILRSKDATGVIVSHLPHIRWICGFTGSTGLLIARENKFNFLTNSIYETQAALEVRGAVVHIGSHPMAEFAKEKGLVNSSDRLIIQPEYLTVAEFTSWETTIPGISFIPIENLLNEHVAIKSGKEIAGMRTAQAISDAVFKVILQYIQPGVRESELSARINYHHLMLGASKMAFETIVASGLNSALPHARPGDRKLRSGEPLLLDFGCMVDGFASDMTRTVHLGEPSDKFSRAYEAVRVAQERAISSASAGMELSTVFQVAQDTLKEFGLNEFFIHSLGHGIGMKVHEWPLISSNSSAILHEGYSVTIEPGVYFPGEFGIRIEDTILIGSNTCERLSTTGRDLLVI